MANREVNNAPPFKPVSKAEYQAMTEKKRSLNLFLVVAILSGLGIAVSFVVFLWNKVGPIDFDETVNNELLGTLGDFVGGILGTLIALYSIYMLVKTLHAQIDSNVNARETNDIVVETNKAQIELSSQQLFDNKFQVFFNQYKVTMFVIQMNNALRGLSAPAAWQTPEKFFI